MSGARGRRFAGGLAQDAEAMNASVDFDYRLLDHDVAGSKAHATMLADQGLLSQADVEAIHSGLDKVADEFATDPNLWNPALEDVHMNVESRLTEHIGDAGRRLHTGRSRNDQVATDLRLYTRSVLANACTRIDELIAALSDKAAAHIELVMPGYTHLQRAQPVRVAHHLLAYVEMFERDRGRLADAAKRANISPLGSGALAGTTLPIDRERTARLLGFDGVTHNSLDAVGDRDFAIESVAAMALCQVHLSRLGEELVLWLSQEFNFASLDESYCSGSSLMPQKVNPDLAELIRGKSGRVMGDWVSLMTTTKGLPLAYNKDLQETQEPLFDASETVIASLGVAAGMIRNLSFNGERMREAVASGYLVATEVADYLVSKGLPFRNAHDISGALVRKAVERGVELGELTLGEFRSESELFSNDVYEWLDIDRAIDRRALTGGPARTSIESEIARIRALLASRD